MPHPFATDEQKAFHETVSRFVESEVRPHADAWDEAGAVPEELHQKAAALGIFGFGIDEAYGGLGFDDMVMRASFGELMGGCGASGICPALGSRNISTGLIAALGSEAQKMECLPDIISGKVNSALAMTEPSGGSDLANLKTAAQRDGDGWRLNGAKTFISGGMQAEWLVVSARTGGPGVGGISAFLVHKDSPGFTRQPLDRKMGWWASDTASLFFDDCALSNDALLGPENGAFGAMMENFNYERITMIAMSLGMMRLCFSESLAFARDRETFGQRLIDHQVIAHKLADMSTRIDATAAWLAQICMLSNQAEMPVAEVCKAKVFATKALEFCASEAMQIFGGAGYLRGNPVERVWREVKVMAIGGGSEEVMRDLAIKQMGLGRR